MHRETRSLGLAIRKRLYVSASGTSHWRILAHRVGGTLFCEVRRTSSECCSFRLQFLARRWWLKPCSSLLPIVFTLIRISVAWKRALCVCGFVCSALNMLVTSYTRELTCTLVFDHLRACPNIVSLCMPKQPGI